MFATRSTFLLSLSVALLLGQVSSLPAQRSVPVRNSDALTAVFNQVVAKPSASTVRIASDENDVALGTIVSADGHILSKASELRGNLVCLLNDGRSLRAKLVGVEEEHDLALLKVEARGLKPIEWRDAKTAEVGNWLAAPGHEGKPVAIGVVSVASRAIRGYKGELRTSPRSNSGYLGVQIMEDGVNGTPLIRLVTEDSPAAKAGLEAGDVVMAIAGQVARSREAMVTTIQKLRPGEVVSIKVKRDDEEMTLSARLAKYPQDLLSRGERMNMMGSELSHRLAGFPVVLQHDLVIKPTDCGGPVVDLDGKAVGINIARAGRTESYALPADVVQKLLPDLKAGKFAVKEDLAAHRVAVLEASIRILELKIKTADDDDDAKKAAALKKKLARAKDELDQAKKEAR